MQNNNTRPEKPQARSGQASENTARITLEQQRAIFDCYAVHGQRPRVLARRVGVDIDNLIQLLLKELSRRWKVRCGVSHITGQRSMLIAQGMAI